MRAIRVKEHGGPEVLRLEHLEAPEPGRGEVGITVEYAGVNFTDTYRRSGLYPSAVPYTVGLEAVGVVDRVGPEVDHLRPGDRVGFPQEPVGAYAELVVVDADRVVPIPTGLDAAEACALLLQGMTAHYLATDTYPLGPGTTAVVLASAGGVGRLLVQVAKRRGARVLAATSTDDKAELARSAGADEVIRYRDVDLTEAVRAATGGVGADVVYDAVGVDTFDRSLASLRVRGRLVCYGQASGPVPPLETLRLSHGGSLSLLRPRLPDYIRTREELEARATDLFTWAAAGELEPRVDRVFPLEEAAEAHRFIESGRTRGKLLLAPGTA